MKMCQTEAELSHAGGRKDRRTNMTKLTVAFGNFAYALKKVWLHDNIIHILSSYLAENNSPSTLQNNLWKLYQYKASLSWCLLDRASLWQLTN